jgi:hypothetical protein
MFRLPSSSPGRRSLYLSDRELSLAARDLEWLERLARAVEVGLVTPGDAQAMVIARIKGARELRRVRATV